MRELSLNVMDIVQNSIAAQATEIGVCVVEDLKKETLTIEITDNGKGMTSEQVKSVVDPFYTTRTTRPVGLGIPLFKMEAEMTGGFLTVESQPGIGTQIFASFCASHIDMVPLGDINATVLPLITGNPKIDFVFTRRRLTGQTPVEFTLDTKEVKAILGADVALTSPEIVLWLRDYLTENTEELCQA